MATTIPRLPTWEEFLARNGPHSDALFAQQEAIKAVLRPQSSVSDKEYDAIADFLGDREFWMDVPFTGPDDPRNTPGWGAVGCNWEALKHFCSVCQFGAGKPGEERPWEHDKILYIAFNSNAFRVVDVKNKATGKVKPRLRIVREINDVLDALASNMLDHPENYIFRITVKNADDDSEIECIEV